MERQDHQQSQKGNTPQVHTYSWVAEHFTKVIITVIITAIISLVSTIATLFISLERATNQQQYDAMGFRIEALEEGEIERKIDHEKVIILEQNVIDINKKLDRIINYLDIP